MDLVAAAAALRDHPRVRAVDAGPEHLQIVLDSGQVLATASAPGWLSLYTFLAPSVTPAQCRELLGHAESTTRRHPVVVGGRLLHRVSAQGIADLPAALGALLGEPPAPAEAAPLLDACRYLAEPVPSMGGWLLSDPERPEARGIIAVAGEGTLRVYLALHQLDVEQIEDALAAELLALSDDLVVGRLAPVAGLGLVVYAVLPLSTPEALSDALDGVRADAQTAAAALSDPVDDPAAMLALLRSWFASQPISDARLAQGVLACAAGTPPPEGLDEPVMASSLAALAELLLETIPAQARSGRLVMQIGLTTAAQGERPFDEVWEVAAGYLRSGG